MRRVAQVRRIAILAKNSIISRQAKTKAGPPPEEPAPQKDVSVRLLYLFQNDRWQHLSACLVLPCFAACTVSLLQRGFFVETLPQSRNKRSLTNISHGIAWGCLAKFTGLPAIGWIEVRREYAGGAIVMDERGAFLCQNCVMMVTDRPGLP